ncbi:hypothetical protein LCGC14_1112480 [marine sediment metagenome]|uniref:Uncharacterized protein n=1 Tax=marine sediment metagenome TaxID=412755 RepID=A0A0F9PPF3_9ZZZZ
MTTLNINFDEVPDSMLIEMGQYKAQITTMPVKKLNKAQTGDNLVVECVITEGKYANRTLRDYIPLPTMATKVKRLAKSAGVTADAGGLDLSELTNKDVVIVVTNTPSRDDPAVIYSNIGDYLPAA